MATRRIIGFLMLLPALLPAQAPPRFVGTVQAIRAEQGELEVKPDQGEVRSMKTIPQSIFQRVAPGEKDLKTATPIQIGDVSVGDRVLVALEPGTTDLRRLVVMSAGDIAKRNEADKQDWQKRGLSGVVASKEGGKITLKMRSLTGESQAFVTVSDKTTYRRYAPDSVKFADAKESNFKEVSVGDQVKARGLKSEDGTQVAADEIVFGTFVTKAGKILAINAETNEISVAELNTNKPLTIKLTADSQIKRMPGFPPMGGGAMPAGGAPGGAPGGGMPPGGPGAAGGPPGGMRPPDLAQMLERIPPSKLADLEAGQTIVVSSTKGAEAGQVTAITILANADTLIRLASAQQSGASRSGSGQGQTPSSGMQGGMSGGMDGLQIPGMIP